MLSLANQHSSSSSESRLKRWTDSTKNGLEIYPDIKDEVSKKNIIHS